MDQVLGFRFTCPLLSEASTAELTISFLLPSFHYTTYYIKLYILFVIVSLTDCLLPHFTALSPTKVSFWVAVSVFSGSSVFAGVIAVRGLRPPRSGELFIFLRTNHSAGPIRPFRIVGGPCIGGTVFLGIGGV